MNGSKNSFVAKFFYRTGHLFVENPFSIMSFVLRLLLSLRYLITELSESPYGIFYVLGRVVRQFWRAFLRGIVPILMVGVLFGCLMNAVASRVGGTIHLLFDALLIKYILGILLPLTIAVVVAARSGSAIAGRFASMPAMHLRNDPERESIFYFSERDIYREVVPQLAATTFTAALFYIVIVACALLGYVSSNIRGVQLDLAGAALYANFPEHREMIIAGLWRSLGCGFIIGGVASAFGIQASEEFTSRRNEMFELHDAIWESIVTSLVLCAVLLLASLMSINK
jgi:ABC-type transporter Mla maintaining outer membrane lipid asymmetry permease subunit MlaE